MAVQAAASTRRHRHHMEARGGIHGALAFYRDMPSNLVNLKDFAAMIKRRFDAGAARA